MTHITTNRPHIDEALSEIASLAGKLQIVRTDCHEDRGQMKRFGSLAKATRKLSFLCSGPVKPAPRRDIENFLGISAVQAERVYDLVCMLSDQNPAGSWPLMFEPAPDVDRHSHPFLDEIGLSLQCRLPQISRLTGQLLLQPTSSGHARRRVFVRAFGLHGREMAAIDTGYIATHIEALVVGAGPSVVANLYRAKVWALQLGADIRHMPEVLHNMHGAFVQCGVPSLVLPRS